MIESFADKRTALLFHGRLPKGFPTEVAQRAYRKLLVLDAAETLDDLKVPPGNRLEALRGNRSGQYSIRVDQWRICFAWAEGRAHKVRSHGLPLRAA